MFSLLLLSTITTWTRDLVFYILCFERTIDVFDVLNTPSIYGSSKKWYNRTVIPLLLLHLRLLTFPIEKSIVLKKLKISPRFVAQEKEPKSLHFNDKVFIVIFSKVSQIVGAWNWGQAGVGELQLLCLPRPGPTYLSSKPRPYQPFRVPDFRLCSVDRML